MLNEGQESDPLWYKNAVIYQLHIRAFYDKNDDGIGDFSGLTQKLDYLVSLGITAVWLLPFYPSPLKDDGYDISDYLKVNSTYGDMKEFRTFLREAHRKGIRVITELIINHTSDQHPWFQRARRAKKGSVLRDFYVWSDTPEKYKDARIIFKDFESSNWAWDPVAEAYYWHRFYSHQPDLNFENPLVRKEVFRTLDYWLEMGVDGFRLDAIPYLYEEEGTNCENLLKTHQFIKELRHHIDANFKDRVLIAEANQWPEDSVAYFGEGDECHMAFHFPVMPRLFMAVQMEDRFPIIDILEQTPIPPSSCQWVMFLRNHDELTLEMVSDEERDYMYRIYAKDPKARINLGIRRRLAPLMDNDYAKIQLMYILLLSLPGTPVIYYGDEIGMGDNYYLGDRNGVRTPMQWSSDRNAGFSSVNPQKLYLPLIIDPLYHFEVVNVENQERNSSSLLWWLRRVLQIYKNYKSFGNGSLEFILSDNSKILAFTRTVGNEILLIITNLSRFSQAAGLDLKRFSGYVPKELFHHNLFPPIKDEPYNVTLGPHGYFWLSLKPSEALVHLSSEDLSLKLNVEKSWKHVFDIRTRTQLENTILPNYVKTASWFERKTCTIQSAKITSTITIGLTRLCLLEFTYLEIEEKDLYLLPLSYAPAPASEQLINNSPNAIVTHLAVDDHDGVLFDAIYSEEFRNSLLSLVSNKKKRRIGGQALVGHQVQKINPSSDNIPSQVLKEEQSNSSIIYNQQYYLKLYRKIEEGTNPDIEMMHFLSVKAQFKHVPSFTGSIAWTIPNKQPMSIAILEKVVPNERSGWTFCIDALAKYYENILALKDSQNELLKIKESSEQVLNERLDFGFIETIKILAQRTAEMHIALSEDHHSHDFTPEPCSILFQHSMYQALRGHLRKTFFQLKKKKKHLSEQSQNLVDNILKSEQEILNFFKIFQKKKINAMRIRTHGDYHLGQVLHTGKDFYIIDFEGEPLQTNYIRRLKRLALRDVAGMIRSFHYASQTGLMNNTLIKLENMSHLELWADFWYQAVSSIYLKSYLNHISTSATVSIIPQEKEDIDYLLQFFLLEKAIYELGYELNTRPDWIDIPCKGIAYYLKNKPLFNQEALDVS